MNLEENSYGWLFDKENGFGRYITEEGMRKVFEFIAGYMGLENGLELGRQLTENYNWLFDTENGLSQFITEEVIGKLLALGAGFMGFGERLELGRLFTSSMLTKGVELGRKLFSTSAMISLQMGILTVFGVVFGFLTVGTNVLLNNLQFTQNATITDLIRIFPYSVGYIDELEIFPTIT